MIHRIRSIQDHIKPKEAWLVSNQTHVEYLTGFVSLLPTEREGFVWLTKSEAALIHASFSPAPSRDDITYLQGCYTSQLVTHLHSLLNKEQIDQVVIDGSTLWHDEYRALSEASQSLHVRIIEQKKRELNGAGSGSTSLGDTTDPITSAREVKDGLEIKAIHEASKIVARAVETSTQNLRAGMTEAQVSQEIEVQMRQLGSIKPAFPTIVAFGPNSALPHHQPGDTILEENMAVLIDCGATYNRYRSDMTRSFWFGNEKPATYQAIEATVMDSYQAGVNALRNVYTVHEFTKDTSIQNTKAATTQHTTTQQKNVLTAANLDSICRKNILKSGYGKYFIHTTGHGVGLDIHESPSISGSNQSPLQVGMVITVEPGIYLENLFGFRYENTISLQ